MKKWLKRTLMGGAGVLGLAAIGGGGFVMMKTSAYDDAINKEYDIPPLELNVEVTPELIERGKHITESLGGCGISECHGSDMAGGKPIEIGPLGTVTGPNITKGGLGAVYSDAEMARLVRHGIKKNGKTAIFMPMHDHNFLPDEDIAAAIAYIRTLPDSKKSNGPMEIRTLGKILDQKGDLVFDVARRIDHENIETAGPPEPTPKYGQYVARLCMGCHGPTFGGGPLPGAPPDVPIVSNITPHETGLKEYSYEQFMTLLEKGIKTNGEKLDPFMPLEMLSNMNEIERKALYEYLRSIPGKEFGSR